MVHQNDLTRAEQTLREHERTQHVVGREAAGIAQDMGLARIQSEDAKRIDARVHAGHDRNVFDRDHRPRSGESDRVRSSVCEQFVDCGLHAARA